MNEIRLTCRCGRTAMIAAGPPIITAECHCTSCSTAATVFEALPNAASARAPTGGTPYVLQRKDRVSFPVGAENMRHFKLKPYTKTRRVVATCCNTPMFLEFSDGHWLSLYAALWPAGQRPSMALRTMTKDRTDSAPLPGDMPNPKSHTAAFMFKLLGAWIAMRFRVPKITVGQERLEVDG